MKGELYILYRAILIYNRAKGLWGLQFFSEPFSVFTSKDGIYSVGGIYRVILSFCRAKGIGGGGVNIFYSHSQLLQLQVGVVVRFTALTVILNFFQSQVGMIYSFYRAILRFYRVSSGIGRVYSFFFYRAIFYFNRAKGKAGDRVYSFKEPFSILQSQGWLVGFKIFAHSQFLQSQWWCWWVLQILQCQGWCRWGLEFSQSQREWCC